MLDTARYDWTAIAADPRFQELHRQEDQRSSGG